MANIFIVITFIILLLLTIAVVAYCFVLYCHPDEKESRASYFYFGVVILGFASGITHVALIPLDVENSREGYGLRMTTLWNIFTVFNATLMILVVPYLLFFYETDSEANIVTRIADSICSYICFVMFFVAFFIIAYFAGGTYTVQASSEQSIDFSAVQLSTVALNTLPALLPTGGSSVTSPPGNNGGSYYNPLAQVTTNSTFGFTVNPGVLASLVGIISFVGFVLLSIYLGNGLIMLPYNLILQWWQKPKRMSSSEITNMKNKLKRKLDGLIESCKSLKGISNID